jgi:hypothetical protein
VPSYDTARIWLTEKREISHAHDSYAAKYTQELCCGGALKLPARSSNPPMLIS